MEFKKMRRFFLTSLIILMLINSAFSQENPRTAVIPFNGRDVSATEALTASDLFETALVKTETFDVIEKTQRKAVLESQSESQKLIYSGCVDESCAVEYGKILLAEQIVLGSFSRLGDGYIITAKVIDVALGRNIRADNVSFSSLDELSDSVNILAYKLAGLTYKQGGEDTIASVFGELFISTNPTGADIYINGVKKGTSPCVFSRIPAGLIKIEAKSGNLYASKDIDIGDGTSKLALELKVVFGNLFIKSSKSNVDVYLNGQNLGSLEDGFFENLPVGKSEIAVKGENLYWEGTVTIEEGETTSIKAYPRSTGFIFYNLPLGAEAEIRNVSYQKLVRGEGELQLWEGKYKVKIFGDNYLEEKMDIVVSYGSSIEIAPDLEYTAEYKRRHKKDTENNFSSRLEKLTENYNTVSALNISGFNTQVNTLQKDFKESNYSFPVLETKIRELVSKTEEKQAEFNRLSEIDNLTKELYNLKQDYEKEKSSVSKTNMFKFLFGGLALGAFSGSGVTWYLGNEAFANYENAASTSKTVEFRDLSQMYDILKLSAGGLGIGFSVLSILNWIKGDNLPELGREIASVSAKLAELKVTQ